MTDIDIWKPEAKFVIIVARSKCTVTIRGCLVKLRSVVHARRSSCEHPRDLSSSCRQGVQRRTNWKNAALSRAA